MASEGLQAALEFDTDIQQKLENIDKKLTSMGDAAAKLSAGMSLFSKSVSDTADAMKNISSGGLDASGIVKQYKAIADAAAKANETQSSAANKLAISEETINKRLEAIFEARVKTRDQMRSKILAIHNLEAQVGDDYNNLSADTVRELVRAMEYADELERRIKTLKMEYNKDDAQKAFSDAIGLSEKSYEDAIAKLEALKYAKEAIMLPGKDASNPENAQQNTKWLDMIENIVDRINMKLPTLKKNFEDAKKASAENARRQDSANKVETSLLAAYGLGEDEDTIHDKIRAISSAIKEMKKLQSEGNQFINEKDVNDAVAELDRLKIAYDEFKQQATTAKADAKIDHILGLDDSSIESATARLSKLRTALRSELIVDNASPEKLESARVAVSMFADSLERMKNEVEKENIGDKLRSSLEMPETTIDEVKDKIGQLKAAYITLIHASENNPLISENSIEAAKNGLDECRNKLEELKNENAIVTKKNDISFALGLDTPTVNTIQQKLDMLKRNLLELKKITNGQTLSGADMSFIKKTEHEIDILETKLRVANWSMRKTSESASQMASIMKQAFSFAIITKFAQNVVKIRGEFEMAEKSLGIIINDANKAKVIFKDIQDIAIRSPFQVKDLVKQTKQLAAYRIETDKLVDTTKMLGDISAGVGVDMNRLILAYGQVKAATVLKGTELRQFSEAGVNMLGGLADRFSEIQKRAVTTGEVLGMISKKMVSFADVEAVLKAQTQAGGTFYKMQEKQAETLQGRISNLKDRIDIMFNEMGKNTEGVIGKIIDLLTLLIDKFELIQPFLMGGLLGKGMSAAVNGVIRAKVAIKEIGTLISIVKEEGRAAIGVLKLWPTAIGAAMAVISAAVVVIRNLTRVNRELRKATEAARKEADEQIATFDRLVSSVQNTNKSIQERNKALNELKTQFGGIIPVENENIDSLHRGTEAYKQYRDAIYQANEELAREKELLVVRQEASDSYDRNLKKVRKNLSLAFGEIVKAKGMIGNNLSYVLDTDAINQAFSTVQTEAFEGAFNSASDALSRFYELLDEYGGKEKGFTENLVNTTVYTNKIENGFNKIIDLSDKAGKILDKSFNMNYGNLGQAYGKAIKDLSKEAEKIRTDLLSIEPSLEFDPAKLKKEVSDKMAPVIKDLRDKINADTNLKDNFKNKLNVDLTKESGKYVMNSLEEYINNLYNTINQEFPDLTQKFGVGEFLQAEDEDIDKYLERLKKKQEYYKNIISKWTDFNSQKGVGPLTQEAYGINIGTTEKEATTLYDAITKLIEGLSGLSTTQKKAAKNNEFENNLKSLISTVKNAKNEFRELNDEGDILFKQKLKGLADKVGVKLPVEYDTESVNKWVVDVKNQLGNKANGVDFTDIFIEFNKSTTEEKVKEWSDQFDALWEKYDTAKKIQEYGFNVDGFDTRKIYNEILSLENEVGKDTSEDGMELAKKISKQRLEMLRDEQEEAMKIMYESQKKALSKTEQAYQTMYENIAKIRERSNVEGSDIKIDQSVIDTSVIAEITRGFKEINDAEWEAYKGTEMYAMAFGDLEGLSKGVLESLRNELEAFKSASALNPTEMKTVTRAITKLNEEIERASKSGFFSVYTEGFKAIGEAMKAYKDEIPTLSNASSLALSNANKAYEDWHKAQEATRNNPNQENIDAEAEAYNNYVIALNLAEAATESLKNKQDEINAKINTASDRLDKLSNAYSSVGDSISSIIGLVRNVSDAFGLAFSDETNATIEGFEKGFALVGSAIAVVSSSLNTLTAVAELAKLAGIGLQAAFWPLLVIGASLGAIVAVIAAKDKKLEKQIESQKEAVEDLQKTYDNLKDSMDKAIDLSSAKAYNSMMIANLNQQKRAIEEAIALEEKRKQNDETKEEIKSLKGQLDEISKSIKDTEEDWLEFMGATSDWQGLARDWASSWLDAFKSAEDGVASLQDSFDSLWDDIVSVQLSNVLAPYIEKLKKAITNVLNDGKVTEAETQYINSLRSQLAEMSSYLTSEARKLTSGSYGSNQEGSLQKGIEGVTEQTAQALEGILNSTRYYVADTNSMVTEIRNAVTGEGENTILTNLRSQTNYLRILSDIASAVYYPGSHRKGSGGLRVFVD